MPTLEEDFRKVVKERRFRHLKAFKTNMVKMYHEEPASFIVVSIVVFSLVALVGFTVVFKVR